MMWRGLGDNYLLWQRHDKVDEDMWRSVAEWMKDWELNAFRLAFAFKSQKGWEPGTPKGRIDYDMMDRVLDILASHGVKGILDFHHPPRKCYPPSNLPKWWSDLTQHFQGDDRILAYELCPSEPIIGKCPGKWALAQAKATDAIREVDPDRTVIWTGKPLEDGCKKNVVYKFGGWSETTLVSRAIYDAKKLEKKMMAWRKKYGEVRLEEFGIHGDYMPEGWKAQKAFCEHLINFCLEKDIGFNFWGVADVGGVKKGLISDYERILGQSNYLSMPLWQKAGIGVGLLGVGFVGRELNWW